EDVPAEESKVRDIINQVSKARKSDYPLTRNLSQWGLDQPGTQITLKTQGGAKEWTVNIGKVSPDGTYLYVNSSPDRRRDVLAVRRNQFDSVIQAEAAGKGEKKEWAVSLVSPGKFRSLTLLEASDTNTNSLDLKPGQQLKANELALEKGK